MRLPPALACAALLVALAPPAVATCVNTWSTNACVDQVEGDPDYVTATAQQTYPPVGATYGCASAGAGATIGLASPDADAFAAACGWHEDQTTGTTFVCASAIALDDVHPGCLTATNSNGVLGLTGVVTFGGLLCVVASGVVQCVPLP